MHFETKKTYEANIHVKINTLVINSPNLFIFITRVYFSTINHNCAASFTGSISENEDPPLPLPGLDGNGIKCQTPTPPLYHRGNCSLSAHHYLLVNVSLGQVTEAFNNLKSKKDWTQKKCGVSWEFVHSPSSLSFLITLVGSVELQHVFSCKGFIIITKRCETEHYFICCD